MAKISELSLDIELMLVQDYHPATISAMLDVPVAWVYQVAEDCNDSDEFEVLPELSKI